MHIKFGYLVFLKKTANEFVFILRALPWSLRQISICTVATYTLFENHFKILNLQDLMPGAYTAFPDDILQIHQNMRHFQK